MLYYLKRIHELGISGTYRAIDRRIKTDNFAKTWRIKAVAKQANHTWEQIARKHNLFDFKSFFEALKNNNFIAQIIQDQNFREILPKTYTSPEFICTQADKFANNCFDILGSGEICFAGKIPWHTDFKYTGTNPKSWATHFYQDIRISQKISSPDVKIPWELSRFQHVYFLGTAYQLSSGNSKYAHAFYQQANDWIDQNPYLLGINWRCPMDVAIRAINFIWGFYIFSHDQTISELFWQKLVCSLYDHAHYLKNNWETSDKPNNHYIADLLGFLYLSCFFLTIKVNIKKTYQTSEQILQPILTTVFEQFDHQIQLDGTSYEGSTKYHQLVFEIALHVKLLCHAHNITLPEEFEKKIERMKNFIRDCTDQAGNLVTIGDDDSGIIVTGIKLAPSQISVSNIPHIKFYKNFGITIIRDNNWFITFRHPTYQSRQPSGHFHQDQLSITLTFDNNPILIDPGSYVYTANPKVRNDFRSVYCHNTFFINQEHHNNRTLASQDLFQLARHANQNDPIIYQHDSIITIQDSHTEYNLLNITAHRKLIFNSSEKSVSLEDWFEFEKNRENKSCSWVLVFDPCVTLVKKNNYEWGIQKETTPLGQLVTNLNFRSEIGYYAPAYGILRETTVLIAEHENMADKHRIEFLFTKSTKTQ